MKKFFVLLLLSAPLMAIADEISITPPEWKDFCPTAFVDVKEPGIMKKINVVGNYWYQRRVDFEKGVEECQAKESNEEIFSCYEALKVEQFKENTDYNARIEARQRAAAGIPEMSDRTDVMLPINNYINSFGRFQANEIR